MSSDFSGILGIETMRGSREIIQTHTFLVNDSEEVRWRVSVFDTLLKLRLKFTPSESVRVNPPINVYSDGEDTVIEFVGWTGSMTYSIIEPVYLCTINNCIITFSVVNMHLGASNKCDFQMYRDFPQ